MTKHAQPASRREGRFLGMPFDLRRPTVDRLAQRMWNPDDRRLFTPKTFGWGYDINFYWLRHPAGYVRGRGGS